MVPQHRLLRYCVKKFKTQTTIKDINILFFILLLYL